MARAASKKYDVFLSHSSSDMRLAAQIEALLEKGGSSVWLDRSEIRAGTLLRQELQTHIRASRVVVLLWSKEARASRWVAAEILTAFHEGRFIVPCVLDKEPLPYFLENAVFLDLARKSAQALAQIATAVDRAPRGPNPVPRFRDSPSSDLKETIARLADGQGSVMDAVVKDVGQARAVQKKLDGPQRLAEKKWPLSATVLNLGGYHRKNAYTLKHWDAIQAGQPPKDRLLRESERFFFSTLFVNPVDPSALNGLGNVLSFERDFDAAEFFIERALHFEPRYAAAAHDLELIRWQKGEAQPVR